MVLLGSAAGCATPRSTYEYNKEPDPRRQEFVVGPGDMLRINVWRDAELSMEVRVRPDGAITMPLVGDVRAAGKTPSQIRQELQTTLATFMKSETARVTVGLAQVQSYHFTVSGNVEKPGLFQPASYVTVIEALALAGEPNRFADIERIIILRPASGGTRRIPINYKTLRSGDHVEQNIVVLSSDHIVVP